MSNLKKIVLGIVKKATMDKTMDQFMRLSFLEGVGSVLLPNVKKGSFTNKYGRNPSVGLAKLGALFSGAGISIPDKLVSSQSSGLVSRILSKAKSWLYVQNFEQMTPDEVLLMYVSEMKKNEGGLREKTTLFHTGTLLAKQVSTKEADHILAILAKNVQDYLTSTFESDIKESYLEESFEKPSSEDDEGYQPERVFDMNEEYLEPSFELKEKMWGGRTLGFYSFLFDFLGQRNSRTLTPKGKQLANNLYESIKASLSSHVSSRGTNAGKRSTVSYLAETIFDGIIERKLSEEFATGNYVNVEKNAPLLAALLKKNPVFAGTANLEQAIRNSFLEEKGMTLPQIFKEAFDDSRPLVEQVRDMYEAIQETGLAKFASQVKKIGRHLNVHYAQGVYSASIQGKHYQAKSKDLMLKKASKLGCSSYNVFLREKNILSQTFPL